VNAIPEAVAAWTDRVALVHATCPGHPDLRAILVRPDGHTAWLLIDARRHPDARRRPDAGQHTDELRQALTHWHGPSA
jgi:aromatic ring hydroxylase-like protein